MRITRKDYSISCIYLITNPVNGKKYVGQTSNLYERFLRHRRSVNAPDAYNRPIVSAFRKYGFEKFIFTPLERVNPNSKEMDKREQFWIDFFCANKKGIGYNACPVAGSTLGFKHSDATKRKVSIASTGRKHSEATKKQMSESGKGKIISDAAKQKNRLAHLGKRFVNRRGRKVEQICPTTGLTLQVFPSVSSAHRTIGGGVSNIIYVCNKKRKTAGGYMWRFHV